jgi:two-component system sensor histidine kinase CreC
MRPGLRLLFAFVVATGLAGVVASTVLGSDVAGLCLLALSAGVGAAAMIRIARGIRSLEAYAMQVHPGARVPLPRLDGELGDLALAVDGMRDRLEDREQREQSVRALAHELKAPLSVIHEAAALLGEALPAADRERLAQQVRAQSRRLLDLGDRMRELSRLEGLRAIVDPREIELLALIDEVATAQVPLAIQHGVGLVWEARADIAFAGDPQTLALLFSNLWSNALAFAPEGTSITVSLRRAGAAAVFTMRDDGPGVSAFELPQLGQRFFSLPRPRDGVRGSGLGLAIVRRAAALHGGDVEFEQASPGLRVTLRLPV